MRKNNRGFTLIELLAVIVILGLLMAIAIPSVTRYITQSRKKTLVNSIDSFITATTTAVNDNDFGALSNQNIIYYIPVSNIADDSCISLEKGGTDPFGNWKEAYVAVNYDAANYSYDYYFTFYDDAGYGMELTKVDEIDANGSAIKNPTPVNEENITTQLGGRATTVIVLEKSGNGSCTAKAAKVESGTGTKVGDVIKIGTEEFYVIESSVSNITMLAKNKINPDVNNPVQNASASNVAFSSTNYWYSGGLKSQYGTSFPAYVYDANSNVYQYVEAYEKYLQDLGAKSANASLISYEQLVALGCEGASTYTCNNSKYSWVKPSSGYYWTGSAYNGNALWRVISSGLFGISNCTLALGVRPIVTISTSDI